MDTPEDLESLLAEIAAEAAGASGLRGAHHDQLGKGWIVYWPHLRLPD